MHGLAPRGLTSELNQRLNARLHEALGSRANRPCWPWDWMPRRAERENTALFAHGVGLLLLQHTGRIRMFKQDATDLFDHYLAALLLRTAPHGKDLPDAAGCR